MTKEGQWVRVIEVYQSDIESGINVGDWCKVDSVGESGVNVLASNASDRKVFLLDSQVESVSPPIDPLALSEVISNESVVDNVNSPSHYNSSEIEVIDKMEFYFGTKALKIFCVINAYKYDARTGLKGDPEEDGGKSVWYICKAKELQQKLDSGEHIHGALDYFLE